MSEPERDHLRHHLLIIALIAWVVFLVCEVTVRINNLYKLYPYVDIPIHFLSGVAVMLALYFALFNKRIVKKTSFLLMLNLFFAVMWEWVEVVGEYFIPDQIYLTDIFFWDGVLDVIANVTGSFAAILLLYYLSRKNNFLEGMRF